MYFSVLFPVSYYPAPPQWVATVSCLLALPPEFMPHSPSPRWPCVNFPSCLLSQSFVCYLILSLVVCFPARCLCASVWSGLCFYRPPCVILHFVSPLSKIMTCNNKGLVLKTLHPWDLFLLFVFYFVFTPNFTHQTFIVKQLQQVSVWIVCRISCGTSHVRTCTHLMCPHLMLLRYWSEGHKTQSDSAVYRHISAH